MVEHGTKVRWRTTISNHRPDVLKKLARDPGVQMGFSDAGAHLRNMAFYNFGLRLLRHVRDANLAGNSFMTVEQAVHRLTGELAEWYGLDAGHLRVGDRADLVVVNPYRLDGSLDTYAEESVEQYGGLARMVNRNDETVDLVLISGNAVVRHGVPTELLGAERTGSFYARAAGRAVLSPIRGSRPPADQDPDRRGSRRRSDPACRSAAAGSPALRPWSGVGVEIVLNHGPDLVDRLAFEACREVIDFGVRERYAEVAADTPAAMLARSAAVQLGGRSATARGPERRLLHRRRSRQRLCAGTSVRQAT